MEQAITGPMLKAGSMVYDSLPIICSIFLPLILGIEAASFIGMPFGSNPTMVPEYWFAIVAISIVFVALIPFIIGFGQASLGMLTLALAFSIIAILWQLFMIIWWIILFITCNGTMECANNIDSFGVVVGVFSGPSVRFLISFVMIVVMFFVLIATIAAEFRARRVLYLARVAAGPIILAEFGRSQLEYKKRQMATTSFHTALQPKSQ